MNHDQTKIRTSDLEIGDELLYSVDSDGNDMVDVITSIDFPEPPCVIARIGVDRHAYGKVTPAVILSGIDADGHEFAPEGWRNEAAWDRIHRSYVNSAVNAYEECADFTDGERLGEEAEEAGNYAIGWHATTEETFRSDVIDFLQANAADVEKLDPRRVGQDFWLTRNGHGAGFWDGNYPQELGERLTKAAKVYGTCDLYVGDDGWVYC